ncbi:contractile injection system protein, VgrG/Pvc8 family [Enterobacter hormaechei]|nr:contractile injection system protein, VgrG/Pvc8 family [Enterobacter hormaechei]MCM7604562.1 contractile injection system protein, VgrG/Pvc8 family [Enterobacter hormaechei]MCM7798170.1 contractile injection system protein, VgrG/Pvc8 family [Enterobacter hormaechei]MCW4893995.1 contractile injection system protein, VgrG/Pvc8 family [Enterobacter hormaechei subsp. xiangfangensis]MCW4944769.1 contractile injection system protein, VgrG/Pvc8 family [Enterobacter hormaechei subsp. xiangfangensis]
MRSGKNVHGIVTHLEWLSTLKDQSHYRLTLGSCLALLRYTRQCAVYQNQSVLFILHISSLKWKCLGMCHYSLPALYL